VKHKGKRRYERHVGQHGDLLREEGGMVMAERREDEYQARKVCAWCGRDMGPSSTSGDSYDTCPRCEQLLREQLWQEMEEERRQRRR